MTTRPHHVAVIDIGKTNAKLALVDLDTLTEIAVLTRPNAVLPGPPWPHFDVEGHWDFLLKGLAQVHRAHRIDAVSVTTHGASVALLDADGGLAAPILDYEHPGPESMADAYAAICPPFADTGSPRQANGLSVGAQLHWCFAQDPTLLDRTATVLTYPQYWGHRLTGELACDVTSIGCHTDLWHPHEGRFSPLVARLGISDKMAPICTPDRVLGSLLPAVAAVTGLSASTPVMCGIHDSNASLYPHVLAQEGPFSVVSTGTWVVVMTMGGTKVALDPQRDTLINVNALGNAVPSARFMGGREYDLVTGGETAMPTQADAQAVLSQRLMLLPSVEPAAGPFQGRQMRWTGTEPPPGSGARAAALAYYLALMTDTCLRLTGATGPAIVEGPFARNPDFLQMLAAASGRPVRKSQTATGTSIGAALLVGLPEGARSKVGRTLPCDPGPMPDALASYAAAWRDTVSRPR